MEVHIYMDCTEFHSSAEAAFSFVGSCSSMDPWSSMRLNRDLLSSEDIHGSFMKVPQESYGGSMGLHFRENNISDSCSLHQEIGRVSWRYTTIDVQWMRAPRNPMELHGFMRLKGF